MTMLHGVDFIDANTRAAVGADGIILRTSNGRQTWETKYSDAAIYLRDICRPDANTGIAVGSYITGDEWYGIILRTTDGGTTWYGQASGDTRILWSVCCTVTGTVVGGLGGEPITILRTIDGGVTLTTQLADVTYDLKNIHYISSNQGTIVGGRGMGGHYKGEIFHPNDVGLTWEKQLSNYPEGFWSVIYSDAMTGKVVGAVGTILKTTNGGVSYVEEEQIYKIPTEFLLTQNWPNPFNSSTVIRYSVPKSSQVQIKVFDILGNEIETLVSKEN